MKRYIEYSKYVMRHKWYVFLFCIKLRVPIWQAIVHDLSKFSSAEFKPYAKTFFNSDGTRIDLRKNGSYDPNNVGPITDFTYAWIHHQKNLHHWQAWISIGDGGSLKPAEIPERYVREMLADWMGASKALTGKSDVTKWYESNKQVMVLHPNSRALVEKLLVLTVSQ